MAAQSDLSFRFEGVEGATFDVVRFELIEGLSQPFRLDLELSSSEPNVELDTLLDSEVTFTIARDGEPVRTVHGIVTMARNCRMSTHFPLSSRCRTFVRSTPIWGRKRRASVRSWYRAPCTVVRQ